MYTKSIESKPMTFFIKQKNGSVDYIDAKNCTVKCGEIWMANLPYNDCSIQSGNRPVFIISNNKNNTYSTVLNVMPITTKMNKRNLPCHVEIWEYQKYGLHCPSTILTEQITSISKNNLIYRMGMIDDLDMLARIIRSMKVQFPILNITDF